jgi:hypothetical protein
MPISACVKPEESGGSFSVFAETFVTTYAETNNKPSEVASKESILRVHLVPGSRCG